MKKYRSFSIFFTVVVGLYLAQAFFEKGHNMTDTLRVAFPNNLPSKSYEPTRIHLAPEYIFFRKCL